MYVKLLHQDFNPDPCSPHPESTNTYLSINDFLYFQKYYNNTHLKYCCLFSFFLPNVKIFFFFFCQK